MGAKELFIGSSLIRAIGIIIKQMAEEATENKEELDFIGDLLAVVGSILMGIKPIDDEKN